MKKTGLLLAISLIVSSSAQAASCRLHISIAETPVKKIESCQVIESMLESNDKTLERICKRPGDTYKTRGCVFEKAANRGQG